MTSHPVIVAGAIGGYTVICGVLLIGEWCQVVDMSGILS